jgi:NAD(P)H-hydrate epimerase
MVLPQPLVPCAETTLIDEAAVALGQDLGQLMENAGTALAHEAARLAPTGTILVACGPGNNGGDGYVCARLLASIGRKVAVWAVTEPRSALCRKQAEALPPEVIRIGAPVEDEPPALVVDAILGTGATGRPHEPIAGALVRLRGLGAPILAADVPSGLGSDLMLPAILTLCFQLAKRDLLNQPGLGEFKTVDIGIRPAAWQDIQPNVMRRFPALKRTAHKGVHGELLVVGGGVFPGALELACRAGIMTGCDLVRAWTTRGPKLPPTVVFHRQPGRVLEPADNSALTALLVRASAVLIGSGLGRHGESIEAARQVFGLACEMGVPVVVDADGIAACADLIRDLPEGTSRVLVTPHRAEARTLLGGHADEETLHAFARPDRVLLAKGTVDLVTDGWQWQHNPRGNPRLAVGGTGDVLAGLAAGLLARGATPFDAARLAVLWLTVAGDELWQEQGPCYDAETLLARLPATLRSLLTPMGMWPPMVG